MISEMPNFRSLVRTAVNRLVAPLGVSVISHDQLRVMRERLERLTLTRGTNGSPEALPEGAAEYLTAENPRLAELRGRYQTFRCPAADPSLWNENHRAQIDLQYFRGDNPYIYQVRDDNKEIHYLLTYFYLKSIDVLGLFERLQEDRLFGVYAFDFGDGHLISRDLLDSINEITFLEEAIGISRIPSLRVLDIGAGYGRLGYRLPTALANLDRILCADAIAESTFLCEYYLKFCGMDRSQVVPLDEIETAAAAANIQVAMNIHSFSECTLEAVDWWLDLIAKCRIPYLFIVPNPDVKGLRTSENNKPSRDFLPSILSRGYRLRYKRPKYCLPALESYGISPTYYYLFERE
jgi:putative sugar O-methyltransferase